MTYKGSKRTLTIGVTGLLAIAIPLSVHAGVFSAFTGVLEERPLAEYVAVDAHNAQSVPLLKAALHADPNPAKGGGDVIVDAGALVPDGDGSGERVDANTRTANGEISVYVVREGDTLSQIAEMFDVSANTILWANDVTDGVIHPGQTLVILPITGIRHVVKEGDTIKSIAKKYEGDAEEIVAYNRLASASSISTGDTVVIPGGELHAMPAQSSASSASRSSGGAAVARGTGSAGYSHPLPGATRTQGIHGYNGVDLAAAAGSGILAAASGEVIVAKGSGWNGGYGAYVVIRHANGTQTLYAHMSAVYVSVGQSVGAGGQIGVVGNTGRSTGIHLHFEVRGATNPF